MRQSLIIGQKFPNITTGGPWSSVLTDMKGKVVYAKGGFINPDGRGVDVLIKRLKNNCTIVKRDFHTSGGIEKITSLFDEAGKLIHCTVIRNGKLVEFAKTGLKKIKSYKVNSSNVFSGLVKALLKR